MNARLRERNQPQRLPIEQLSSRRFVTLLESIK
jgi:hypothetical protein